MKTKQYLIFIGICSLIFHSCYASDNKQNSNNILDKEIFTTFEEKIELFKALGITYSNEVTMSPELAHHLSCLAKTPEAQDAFEQNESYQHCMQDQNHYKILSEGRWILDIMAIKKINPVVGYGIIANQKIKAGTILGLYAGEVFIESTIRRDETYIFDSGSIVPGCPNLIIDAKYKGNELRFINSSQYYANCEPYNFLTPTGEKRIIYYVIKDIEQGEQILTDYGDYYWTTYRRNQYQELGNAPEPKNLPMKHQAPKESSFRKGFKKGFLNKK